MCRLRIDDDGLQQHRLLTRGKGGGEETTLITLCLGCDGWAKALVSGVHVDRTAATAQGHGSIAAIRNASRSRARAALRRARRSPRRKFLRGIWKPRAVGDRRGASAFGATIARRHGDASPHKWGGGRDMRRRHWKSAKAQKTVLNWAHAGSGRIIWRRSC